MEILRKKDSIQPSVLSKRVKNIHIVPVGFLFEIRIESRDFRQRKGRDGRSPVRDAFPFRYGKFREVGGCGQHRLGGDIFLYVRKARCALKGGIWEVSKNAGKDAD